jgi:hypothetical protein
MNFKSVPAKATAHWILTLAILGLILPSNPSLARETSITFSGFIKTDIYQDTRNTVSVREGQFMLFPMNKVFDEAGNDINRNTQFNMLAIQTRLLAQIKGPDAFGARTTGLIEAAFFGSTDANINTLRLRHAWVKLDWENTSLLVGQAWHPLFVTQSFPGTVSFSTGAPFQAFSRNPQIRLTRTAGPFTGIVAAMSQRDFTGPGGTSSLRNSAIPNLHAQLQISAGDLLGGFGVDFKRLDIAPKALDPVDSWTFLGFLNIPLGIVTSKTYVLFGENLMDQTMLGGVARATDGPQVYPYQTLGLWHELTTGFMGEADRTRYELGLFTGYSKNFGTSGDEIQVVPGFSRGADVDHLYRIAPRIQVQSGSVRFSMETDITTAAYGIIQPDGSVSDTEPVTNVRLLLGAWLFF